MHPLASGFNVISGLNGSGKTSILEAIYHLGSGRSFRSPLVSRLVRYSCSKFELHAQILNDGGRKISVGMERSLSGAARSKISEEEIASMTELASLLPIRLINSQSHQLFESGPSHRRKYLDWGLFYQYDHFINIWRQFERILKQRNVLLKARKPKGELNPWTNELVSHALELDRLRQQYVKAIYPIFARLTAELLSLSQIEMTYYPGWDEHTDYPALLEESFLDEIRFGHTLFGPHRADLTIAIDRIPVKHYLSRGQQKLLICAMILAQGILLAEESNKELIYLVDDLPSELDSHSRQKLISLLSKQNKQVFITAIESEAICDFVSQSNVPIKLFHVEHGGMNER